MNTRTVKRMKRYMDRKTYDLVKRDHLRKFAKKRGKTIHVRKIIKENFMKASAFLLVRPRSKSIGRKLLKKAQKAIDYMISEIDRVDVFVKNADIPPSSKKRLENV